MEITSSKQKERQCSDLRRAGTCAHHRQRLIAIQHAVDVVDDFSYVVVWDFAGPASANTFGTVDQHHGNDGHIPLWLYALIVIVVVLQ